MFIPLTTALSVIEKITVDKPSKRACAGPHVVPDPRQPRAPGYDDPDPWRAATSPGQPPHHSPGWQKLRGSTGGPRRKVWTRTKILSPNIHFFVAN